MQMQEYKVNRLEEGLFLVNNYLFKLENPYSDKYNCRKCHMTTSNCRYLTEDSEFMLPKRLCDIFHDKNRVMNSSTHRPGYSYVELVKPSLFIYSYLRRFELKIK